MQRDLSFIAIRICRLCICAGLCLPLFTCAASKPALERFHHSARVTPQDFPDSDAVILLERVELIFTYSPEHSRPYAEQLHTRRIQILKPEGLQYIKKQIPFDDRSAILHVQARRIAKDGEVVPMMADRVVDVGRYRSGSRAAQLYPGTGYKLTKVSDVQVGDVIEYSYVRVYRDPRWVDPISASGPLPIVRSEILIDYPRQFDVDYRVSRGGKTIKVSPIKLPSRVKSIMAQGEGVAGNRLTFLFENEKAVFPEELMGAMDSVTVQVHPQLRGYSLKGKRYQAYASWDDVAKWYVQLINGNDRPDAEVASVVRGLGGKGGSKREKLKRVQRYLQDEIDDVPTFLNLAALPVNAPGRIAQAGLGDAKDQASLGLAMLREMGVDGFPVLVSRRGSYSFLPDHTTPAPFNHVIIAIPSGGRYSFIDPSSELLPTGRLPGELQGQLGLLIRRNGQDAKAEIIELPVDPADLNTRKISYNVSLAKNGTATGQALAVLTGLEATHMRKLLRSDAEGRLLRIRQYLEEGEASRMNWQEVLPIGGEKSGNPDAPLKLQIIFGASELGRGTSDGFSIDLQSIIGKPFGSIWREVRYLPLVLSHQFSTKVDVKIALPESMGVNGLPAPSHVENEKIAIHDLWSVAGGTIFIEHDVRLYERQLSTADYPSFRRSLQVAWAGQGWPIEVVTGGTRGETYEDAPF